MANSIYLLVFFVVFLFFSVISVDGQQCNVNSVPSQYQTKKETYTLSSTTVAPNAPATVSNNEIVLSNYVEGGSTAWLLPKQRVVAGFKIKFSVKITKKAANAEGFAFVVQGGDATARGGGSANLGYTIPNSIAIEFDQFKNNNDDSAYGHIELHTRYNLDNSAASDANIPCVGTSCAVTNVQLDNAVVHTIHVWYLPGSGAKTNAATTGRFQVFVNTDPASSTPKIQFDVNDASISNMLTNTGIAYLGFSTSGTSTSNTLAQVVISNVLLEYVGPEPKLTKITTPANAPPYPTTASNVQSSTPQLIVQLYDACNNPLPLTINDALTAKLNLPTGISGAVSGQNTRDTGDGKFQVFFWSSTATSGASLELSLKSGPLLGSPFAIIFNPGPASTRSIFDLQDLKAATSPFTAGIYRVVRVTARDQFDNPALCANDRFTAQFGGNPANNAPSIPASCADGIYSIPLGSNVTFTGSMSVRLNNIDIQGSPVTGVSVVPADYSTVRSEPSGAALVSSTAGTSGLFVYLRVVDSYNNLITVSTLPTRIVIQVNGVNGPNVAGTFVAATGLFQFPYYVETKGTHKVSFYINNDLLATVPNPRVLAAAPTAGKSSVAQPIATTASVGSQWSALIDAKDQYDNLRDTVNPTNYIFRAAIRQVGGQTTTYTAPCVDTPAGAVNNGDVKDFRCVFSNADSKYQISSTFLKSGPATVHVELSTNNGAAYTQITNNGAISVSVSAADPSPSNSLFELLGNLVNGVLTVAAGTESRVRITMKDSLNNTRPASVDLDLVKSSTLTVKSKNTPIYFADADSSKVTVDSAAGTYLYPFIPKRKASYSVQVNFGSESVRAASSYTINVGPGAVDDGRSTISGPALDGMLTTSETSFQIYSRDAFDNMQNCPTPNTLLSPYSLTLTKLPSTAITFTSDCVDGIYTIKFTAPSDVSQVRVLVTRAGNPVKDQTVDVRSADNRRDVRVETDWKSTVVAGVPTTFTLTEMLSATMPDTVSTNPAITLKFELVEGQSSDSSEPIQGLSCPSRTSTPAIHDCTFTPKIAGRYRVRVYANNIESSQSVTRPPSDVLSADFRISAGAIHFVEMTANSYSAVAGVPFLFTLQAFDIYKNPLTSSTDTITITDILETNPSFDAKCNADTNGGFYQCSAVFTKANNGNGTLHTQISFTSNSKTLLPFSVKKNVMVTAGVLDGSKAYFKTASPQPFIAGVELAINVFPLDKYGNTLTQSAFTSLVCIVTIDSGADATSEEIKKPFTQVSGTQYYTSSFVPIKAKGVEVPIALVCGGQQLKGDGNFASPSMITIRPDAPSESNSEVIGPNFATAGASESFVLFLRDKFNNPLTNANQVSPQMSVDASWTCVRDATKSGFQQKSVLSIINAPQQPGRFTFSFTPSIASPGNYSFNFYQTIAGQRVLFNPLKGNYQSIQVNAGPVESRLSEIQPITVNGVTTSLIKANAEAIAIIQLRDRNFNPVLSSPDDLVLFYYNDTPSCRNDLQSVNEVFKFNKQTADNLGDGRYSIRISTTKAGSYFIKGLLGGDENRPIQPCDANALTFRIIPGDLNITKTKVSKVNDGRAGDVVLFSVILVDSWDNQQLYNSANNVKVGVAPTVPPTTGCTGPILPFNAAAPDALTDNNDGSFLAKTETTLSGTFRIQITVNGQLAAPSPDACPSLIILPSFVTTFSSGNVPTTKAGTSAMVSLTGRDKFGNIADPNAYGYKATIQRTGGSPALDEYNLIFPASRVGDPFNQYLIYSLAWQGNYTVTIELSPDPTDPDRNARNPEIRVIRLPDVDPFTCAAKDPTKPYRCIHNDACVADVTQCGAKFTPAVCANRCETGSCASSLAQCPSPSESCPSGFIRCSSGECRPTIDSCPAKTAVCPRGYFQCSDGVSCHRNASACIDLPSRPCAAGLVQCRSGACVTRLENCPTDISCGKVTNSAGNQVDGVLCGDGSCKATEDDCNEQSVCPSTLPYRCPDGSCRFNLTDCPTHRTCPKGWTKCENGWCVSNAEACRLWSIVGGLGGCPMNSTRCPDSSCAPNGLLCPTAPSCPAELIRCADGACVKDIHACATPSHCHPRRPFMCPDGSCAINATECPTGRTCGIQHPVKCSDGSCAASVTDCPVVCSDGKIVMSARECESTWVCPSHLPVRCSDGSCVTSILHCPIEPQCPSTSPIRCADGRCVVSADVCLPRPAFPLIGSSALVTALKCPSARPFRCPSGDCAESRSLCPTVQPCAVHQKRCIDGTCRTNCPSEIFADSKVACPSQHIQCPQSFQGIVCQKSIADCPQAPVCPHDKPIKCADSSCALSLDDCPNVWHPAQSPQPPKFNIDSAACPMGRWATRPFTSCGSSTSCPPFAPAKCWDDSCRALPEDCPPVRACKQEAPYLCPSGQCRITVDALCSTQARCSGETPVLCPWSVDANRFQCVANSSLCIDPRTYVQPSDSLCKGATACNGCPDSRKRCRAGNCVTSLDDCEPFVCPAHIPFMCSSGLCARTKDECDRFDGDGCAYDEMKCLDGACVPKTEGCGIMREAPKCTTVCKDGSCMIDGGKCPLENGCPSTKPYRCWSKTCAVEAKECVELADTHNACPFHRPYRCADGYCAFSSSLCPIIPSSNQVCGQTADGKPKRFRCADGSCALYQEQCPVVRPCLAREVRCNDGSCRSLDDGACPAGNTCPTDRPTRCPSGLCAASLDACPTDLKGTDLKGGCPANQEKCLDGRCASPCTTLSTALGNGCPPANPFKCSNGECVTSMIACKLANGCSASTPYRCGDGQCSAAKCNPDGACASGQRKCPDGSCIASSAACPLSNGCSASTPIRCANGECAALPAVPGFDSSLTCKPVVVCDALRPFLCADNSCAISSKYCRPLWSCPAGYQLCKNGTCILNEQSCSDNACPPSSPSLCPDGSCRKSASLCPTTPSCPADTVKCYDGICRQSFAQCVQHKLSLLGSSYVWSDAPVPENITCPLLSNGKQPIMCHDGRCVADEWQCGLVPACPELKSQRCDDGSCISFNDTCKTIPQCPSGTLRCEDGFCRSKCLSFAGCSSRSIDNQAPKRFYCPGRREACVDGYKKCFSITQLDGSVVVRIPSSAAALNAMLSEGSTQLLPGQEVCAVNCQRNNVAMPQTVSVSPLAAATIDLSFDNRGSARSRLQVGAGAFNRQMTLQIVPRSQSEVNRDDFLFGAKILSTPFACSLIDGATEQDQLIDITAEASVDRISYDPTAVAGELEAPCFAQSVRAATPSRPAINAEFSITPNAASVPGTKCKGTLVISATTIQYTLDKTTAEECNEVVDIKGKLTSLPSPDFDYKVYSNGVGVQCLCYNVTESNGNNPAYPAGSVFCGRVKREEDRYYFYAFFTSAAIQESTFPCPATSVGAVQGRIANLSLVGTDTPPVCSSDSGISGVTRFSTDDICLGKLGRDGWACVKGDYQSRFDNPPYRGGNPYWMSSQQVQCDGSSFAFVQIDRPPKPEPPVPECGWWCQYWKYVVGITVGVGGFALVAAYASSRLVRYRRKYRETKQKNIELHERRKELDEFAGGLGIADDDGEVAMVANPLVIEMQELEQQMKRVNEELNTDQQKEVREIDQLDIERQRLQAEIERVRSLLAQQQKGKAPTRMSDAPLTFAPRPAIPANTATVNPGLGFTGAVPSGPAMGRQDFGQVRGPTRKKQID